MIIQACRGGRIPSASDVTNVNHEIIHDDTIKLELFSFKLSFTTFFIFDRSSKLRESCSYQSVSRR